MHLDSVTQFRKMEPKKKYRYTYLRFEKGQHNELINTRAAVYEIDGNFLILPIKESVYTSESEKERLHAVKEQIESHIGVQTEIACPSFAESQLDKESERKYDCDEKSLKMSGRSKPPSVLCGIRLSVKPGPGPDAREGPVLTCTRRDSPFHRHPRIDARRVSAREGGARPGGLGRLIAPRGAYRFCAIAMTLAIRT